MRAPPRAAGAGLAGLLMIIVALAFDASPLFVPGVAFAAIGVFAPPLVWLSTLGVRIRRVAGEPEVAENARFTTTVLITAGRAGLYGAELLDPLCPDPVTVSLGPATGHAREARVEIVASFSRRGRKRLEPPVLRIADPLGLSPVYKRASERVELLVVPRTEPVEWTRRNSAGNRSTAERSLLADAFAASEVDGLRPYRPGTPASRIHWAALARGQGLLERRMRAEQESRPLVVLDSRCDDDFPERLDAAVRAAASLVLDLARRGGCGLLTADGGRALEVDSRLGGWPTARTRLALILPAHRPPALVAHRRPGMLFYVAAQTVGRLPQILLETGGALVLPLGLTPPEGSPVSFRVSGCIGYELAPRGGRGLAPNHRRSEPVRG